MIELHTPAVGDLPRILVALCAWQVDDWPGQLHPGDLGWHSTVGRTRLSADLRVWSDGTAAVVAVGLLDGDVLRIAVDPARTDDRSLAERMHGDLARRAVDAPDATVIEARGAGALTARLRADGWVDVESWTPLRLDLTGPVDLAGIDRAGLRVDWAGAASAETWTEVHWSAFRGTPLDGQTRANRARRWRTMTAGPVARLGHHLIGRNGDDAPVAVASVWMAGTGRPGLIEPLGVHRDHHGRGYGVSMTLAAARTLRDAGASSAVVVAEDSNAAARATYLAAGFTPRHPVADLRRQAAS